MTLLQRRPRVRSGIQRAPQREFPAHRAWLRQHFQCAIAGKMGHICQGRIEAAHYDGPVPNEERGGKGLKRHDKWCWPACTEAHRLYHTMGWARFDSYFGADTKKIAEECVRRSPHRLKWEKP